MSTKLLLLGFAGAVFMATLLTNIAPSHADPSFVFGTSSSNTTGNTPGGTAGVAGATAVSAGGINPFSTSTSGSSSTPNASTANTNAQAVAGSLTGNINSLSSTVLTPNTAVSNGSINSTVLGAGPFGTAITGTQSISNTILTPGVSTGVNTTVGGFAGIKP